MTKESQNIYNIDSKIESPPHNRSASYFSKSSHHRKSSKHTKKHSRSRSHDTKDKDKSKHRTSSAHHRKSSKKSKKTTRSRSRSKDEYKIVDKSLLKSIKNDVDKLNQMKLSFNNDNIQLSSFIFADNTKAGTANKSNEINQFISKCKQISSSEKKTVDNLWKTSNMEIDIKVHSLNSKTYTPDGFNKVI
jgi:hypothetical protein